jgi:hypothetical protein
LGGEGGKEDHSSRKRHPQPGNAGQGRGHVDRIGDVRGLHVEVVPGETRPS